MRVGDFSIEVVAADNGAREIESGHVLARPGQVYKLRLRNHGPLRAVADISIDGRPVTGGGLVLNAWCVVDLERPIHATERGRFTVIAEGNERVFGPDGGRDNPDLGLIEARFRRELPTASYPRVMHHRPSPGGGIRGPVSRGSSDDFLSSLKALMGVSPSPLAEPAAPAETGAPGTVGSPLGIERAAGTGLTGASDQEFMTVPIGALESEATVIKLRLVIATEAALAEPRPLPQTDNAPARPVARP